MKIAIFTNLYKSYHRQDLCIESLIKLKKMYPDILSLHNIANPPDDPSMEGETQEYDFFTTHHCLKRSSQDHDSDTHKPFMSDIFKFMGEYGEKEKYDYVVFVNSDIIVSDRAIKLLITDKAPCYFISRLNITDIETLDDQTISPVDQYSVAGMDLVAIRPEEIKKIEQYMPDYIISEPCWDTHYFILSKLYIPGTRLINSLPPLLYHVDHDQEKNYKTKLAEYTEDIFHNQFHNHSRLWYNYVYSVLYTRQANEDIRFYHPLENEKEIEDTYFNNAKLYFERNGLL